LDSLLRYSIPIRANYQLCLKYRGFVWAVLPDAGRGAMLGEFLSLIPSLGSVSYVKQFRIAKTALPLDMKESMHLWRKRASSIEKL